MITKEQILEILKTWPIYNGFMFSDNIRLKLVDPTQQYLVEFTKDDISFRFQLCKIKDLYNDMYTFILFEDIPDDIQLEAEYLVTTKVKDYIKSELNKMFSNKDTNGFDALMND